MGEQAGHRRGAPDDARASPLSSTSCCDVYGPGSRRLGTTWPTARAGHDGGRHARLVDPSHRRQVNGARGMVGYEWTAEVDPQREVTRHL